VRSVHFGTPEGKRFIDFNSQLMCVNVGHGDERVVRATRNKPPSCRTRIRSWHANRVLGLARTTCCANPRLCVSEPELREAFSIIDKGLELTDRPVR